MTRWIAVLADRMAVRMSGSRVVVHGRSRGVKPAARMMADPVRPHN